ncbi:MAG: hypothetical protein IJU58_02915 [Clostridia bacterium]|nr:hypothetical protein [Clostridia bacterium]
MSKIRIYSDTFDISRRLCEIDPAYFVVYNTDCNRFEVHNSQQYLDTFCLTVDGELDSRVISKVFKTRKQNIDKLLDEIACQNEALQKEQRRVLDDEMHAKLGETFDYLKNHDNINDAYTTRFV